MFRENYHNMRASCSKFFTISLFSGLCILPAIAVEIYCGKSEYGLPALEDCTSLLDDFANSQDTSVRVFDEEQLRADAEGSWPGLQCIFGTAMIRQAVQIPRVFTRSECYGK